MKRAICYLVGVLLVCYCLPGQGLTMSERQKKLETVASGLDSQAVYWYEHGVKKPAWMATDEIAVFRIRGKQPKADENLVARQFHPEAVVTSENEAVIFLKVPEPVGKDMLMNRLANVMSLPNIDQARPVYYSSASKTLGARMVLTGSIIVRFPSEVTESTILAIEEEYGLERLESFDFSPNAFLYQCDDPLESLDIANRLYESGQVEYAYPNWLRELEKKYRPDDTLFNDQWHLENTGQGGGTAGEDVKIVSAWDNYRGSKNEIIAIVDDGLETAHEDLTNNVIAGLSWDYVGGDSNPSPGVGDNHGTACAGVAAARGDNSKGVAGAAFLTGLVGHRLLGNATDLNEAKALTRNNPKIDIYSNSWGPTDGIGLRAPGDLTENALKSGTTQGRFGLGSIFVWAGGNGRIVDLNPDPNILWIFRDDSNYDGYANSRFTIAVAASDNHGKQSWYSEKGANILVNAPSNGGTLGITTTDRTGASGYDSSNYTDTFGGTSSSCPLVAGIVALMLEAKPKLTWRDVQHILIKTVDKNDPTDSDWKTNGDGYWVNHKYGFGRVDAQEAVKMAASWTNVAAETSTEAASTPYKPIPDNDPTGVSDKITIAKDIDIEFVEIYFSAADHTWWGDLEVTLISPEGTESVLSEKNSFIWSSSDVYDDWRFGSVRHFGESSLGEWTLKVKDSYSDDTGTFQSWKLKIYGTPAAIPPDPPVNLSASAVSATQIDLSWTDDSTNESGFKIERKVSGGNYSQIAKVGADASGYSDTNCKEATTYRYRVRAYNNDGDSDYSNEASATTPSQLPDKPSNLSATSISSTQIDLSWSDNSSNELGFKIERKVSGGTYSEIARVGANVTTYSDKNCNEGTTYTYRVRAFNAAGNSIFSNKAAATTPSDVEAFVTRFYWECLGREPDPKGLNDWTNGLIDGVHTGADVARHFINSTEFQDKYYSDEEYLEILYYAFFDRPPDPVGWNFWLGELKAGKSRGYVLDGFLRSQEFYDLCWKYGIFPHSAAAFVYRFYDECLGREPERKGLEDWTKGLLDGVHTGADVARHFINSTEFQSKNFSDEEYIDILYWAFFNRPPDQAGKNFWLGELKAGKDRGYVLDGFLKSDEFRELCEKYGITPY